MSYIDDETISSEIFDDEEVPGPNTVSLAQNEKRKTRILGIIHAACGKKISDPLITDDYGILGEIALKLYKAIHAENVPVELDQSDMSKLVAKGYKAPVLGIYDTVFGAFKPSR